LQIRSTAGERDALARFERGERFDLVLCDLLMPVMTGIELHEPRRARDPAQAGASRS
jgi:CheY-like chemotaxis protein